MELMKWVALIALVLCLEACGLTTQKDSLPPVALDSGTQVGTLQGNVTDIDGHRVQLGSGASRIQVVMFVSETCSVCRAETKSLISDRSVRGVPTNADFLSIVVGAIPDDASDWRSELGVNWAVAVDPGDSLFRNYCPSQKTPCVVLRNPIVNQYKVLTGEHPISEWEAATGPWSFSR